MRKLIMFMHVSLDGFVAGTNGEMDWISVDDAMFDYAGDQTNAADTALYGRVTYQMMDAYWPTAGTQPNASKHDKQHSAWYNSVEKIVLSRSLKQENVSNARLIASDQVNQLKELKGRQGKNIVVFGSPGAGHFLTAEKLVDEYWLFINPVLLGKGIPMFKDAREKLPLKLFSSTAFKSGVVCLHYAV